VLASRLVQQNGKMCSLFVDAARMPFKHLVCAGAVELRNALSQAFGLELSATVTFDHPTVAALAGHIAGGKTHCT
jgi:Phosphopantetheine attachment site